MLRFLTFLLCLLLAGCVGPPGASQGPKMLPEDLAERTVALVVQNPETGHARAYCSGVWVRPDVIATANHCVLQAEYGFVTYVVKGDVFYPGDLSKHKTRGHGAIVTATDEEHDLALLTAVGPLPGHKYATVSVDQLYQGQMVQTMGSPKGLMFSYSHGDISAVRMHSGVGRDDEMVMVQTTAPISPGNSGGALFNAYGEIVGICHGSYSRAQGLNLFIHYQYLDALVRKSL